MSLLLNTTATGATTPSFPHNHTVSTFSPTSVAVADVNGDGKPDLVIANGIADTVSVLLRTTLTATGTITESDPPSVGFSTPNVSVNLSAGTFSMTVSLEAAENVPATIPFTVSGTAVDGIDYSGLTASPLVIPAGQTSATITGALLPVNPGFNKTLMVTLGTPTNAILGIVSPFFSSETLTIIQPNTLSIADGSAIEPSPGGTVNMNFTVTRTGDPSALTIAYTTVAGTAKPTTDFTPMTGFTTFAAGSATATIGIPIFGNGVYNNPNLTFSVKVTDFAQDYQFPMASSPYSVTVGDLNGDGKPDLVIANQNNNTVSVLLNTTAPGAATPSFSAVKTFAVGYAEPRSVTISDINGDGKPDLVVNNVNDNTVSVLLNTMATGATVPAFATQQAFPTGNSIHYFNLVEVFVADLNGDGKPDLIVSTSGTVLLNTTATGQRQLLPLPRPVQMFSGSQFMAVAGRVNGDGKPDLNSRPRKRRRRASEHDPQRCRHSIVWTRDDFSHWDE